MSVTAIVIGRNEGARLVVSLASLKGEVASVIYVDSGSSDGSVSAAKAAGAQVVALDMGKPFTAARARNAGLTLADTEFVFFLDGDCRAVPGFVADAIACLEAHPQVVVVCGRRREIAPEASVYNALADREWDGPSGAVKACGGDAVMRAAAVRALDGYNPALIAGEEPDLCLRLRAQGWGIWRLDRDMTLHDADMHRFEQWWQRAMRAGHAFAEGAMLHGAAPERHWVAETRRALLWGAVLPLALLTLSFTVSWGWLLWLVYPAQVLRLSRRGGWAWGFFTVLGKFAEARGAVGYYWRRLRGGEVRIIEYK
ncbi:glycosyltransferase family 2 protein [Roseovarius sp. LXJ103]|uniref:glycosyltransferase n=1 Tax=Roseovarius carneus TaxID=2853164 RepID=UPI000D6200D4|nr:glycosyltransferase family A protein [Roseovarius carneus]MBZ8119281.1 glycosyltransferase family 2 protein [Roseovarius carneus]PWE35097.1 glycosyl transferase [Pelagicola sp. LXJ1103]